MKRFASLAAAIVLGLTLAGAAHAAPTPDADAVPRDGVATPNEPRANDSTGHARVLTGRVLKVNADEGTIVIQTPIGVLALRGPSDDLRDVTVGDIVQVEMVGDDDNYPSASPPLAEEDEK